MLVAAAAMTFASCQREEMNAPKETFSTTLTLNTEVEATKTYLGADNTVLWGENESVVLYLQDGEVKDGLPVPKFISSTPTSDFNGEASAEFSFTIDKVTEASEYALGGIYPASASQGIDNKNAAAYKVSLPATQNQVDGKYDSSAYIMVLKPEVVTELPTEYTASFRRAVALNKITLIGVKEDISSVEITVPEKKYLAGRRYMNLTTGESGEIYDSGSQTNVVKVNGDFKAGSFDVWFCSWGVELVEGDALTVKMTSANNTYTRTITTRAEGIKFVEGDLNTLTINMASAEVEAISTIAGDYLIASKTSSGWFLMTPSNSNSYYEATDNVSSSTTVSCADFYNVADVENYVWRVAKYDNGYSIQSVNTNKYVTYSGSDNKAYANAELDAAAKMDIQLNGQTDVIESMNVAGRKLKYNASNPRFAFYETTQTDVYLIPWIPDTTPRINVTDKELSVVASATTVDIPYTLKNITGNITAKVADGATMTRVSASVQGEKVVVTFDANNASEAKTATIVLSYEGAQDVNVVITQEAAGATKQYYVKVTSAPTDWSGTYLIVAGTSVATAIDGSWLKYATATIDDNKIEATATTNAYAVTIQKVASQLYYTIKLANGQYLGTPNSNGIKQSTSVASDFYWKFSVSNSLVKIEANSYSGRILRLNGTSGFRTYTTNTGTQATLYRLEGGESGGETPEPEEPETPVEPIKLSAPVVKCSDSDITANSLKFTWDAVANADNYEVTFNNGTPIETTNTYYEATGLTANTNYSISVKAVGDDVNYTTSDAGTATVKTKEEQQSGGGDVSSLVLAYTFNVSSFGTTGYGVHKNIAKNNNMTWTITCGQGGYLGINKAANVSKLVLGDYLKVGTPIGYNASTLATAVISDTEMLNVGKVEFVGNSVTSVSGTTPTQISLVFSQDGNTYSLIETQAFNETNGNTFEFAPKSSGYYAVVISGAAWFRLTGTQIKYYTN